MMMVEGIHIHDLQGSGCQVLGTTKITHAHSPAPMPLSIWLFWRFRKQEEQGNHSSKSLHAAHEEVNSLEGDDGGEGEDNGGGG